MLRIRVLHSCPLLKDRETAKYIHAYDASWSSRNTMLSKKMLITRFRVHSYDIRNEDEIDHKL